MPGSLLASCTGAFSHSTCLNKGNRTQMLPRFKDLEDFEPETMCHAPGDLTYAIWWDPHRLYTNREDFLSAHTGSEWNGTEWYPNPWDPLTRDCMTEWHTPFAG
eukprot:3514858-Heterocapsa_arctica.AAC.1